MSYFVSPPQFDANVPKFLYKRYVTSFAKKMIAWSTAEYFSAIAYFEKVGDRRSADMIKKHFTVETVMARHPDFKRMCQAIDTEIYNSLDRRNRALLRNAYFIN